MNKFESVRHLSDWLSEHKKLVLTSQPQRLTRMKILLHALATGDFNPGHCVGRFYKHSMFGNIVSHGIAVLARAEGQFVRLMLAQVCNAEIICFGIKAEDGYKRPLRLGEAYEYVFEISGLKKHKRFWKIDCHIVCQTVGPDPHIVAEWDWQPAVVDHSDKPEHLQRQLRPRSYAYNVFRYVVPEVARLFGIGTAWVGCTAFIFCSWVFPFLEAIGVTHITAGYGPEAALALGWTT